MAIVQTENLRKTYSEGDNTVVALDDVSLSLEPGAFVSVMGPSGCGKSTLLHMLGGLDAADGGVVRIDGTDITTLSDDALTALRRRRIGFVFQFFNLVPVMTTVENVALPLTLDGMPAAEAEAKATKWLQRVGLGERLTHMPDQLSGGQQQRVAIARALVTEPALVLADEPTGNLDSRAADDIAGLLREMSDEMGRTVLMVTHDPRIAAYAHRLVFLKDGKIVDDQRLSGEQSDAQDARQRLEALA